jgi:hypothetical protein
MKTASFTVHATTEQSKRWKLAAEAEGHRSAGTWLAAAADSYLKVRAKAGLPLPLAWRHGHFHVRLEDSTEPRVRGWVAPPFGLYRGSPEGPIPHGSTHLYSLAYLPERRIVATFRTARNCKALASELATVLLRGDPPPPEGVIVERHRREAK